MAGIITGLDRRGAMPHVWEGRPKDLPFDVAYAFTDDKLKANWRQLMEAIAQTLITGVMCEEGSATYGYSTTTQCRLTLPDGYTELNDYLIIGDGSRVWRVKVSYANELTFGDLHLISGTSGTADYNTIQDNLRIVTLSKEKLGIIITKNEISLGAFADALHGDDIRISEAIATTIKDLYDDYYTEHESDGTHSDDIIGNSNLKKDDVLITQGFINHCRNGEFNINNAVSRDYWTDILTPTVTPTAGSKSAFPQWYAKIDTNALDEGIFQSLGAGYEPSVPVRKCFYAKGDAGGEVIKAILTTITETTTEEITLTTSWTKYYVDITPTNLTTFESRFVSNTGAAQTFYLAMITIANGDIHTLPEGSPNDKIYDIVLQDTFFVDDITGAGDVVFAQFDLLRSIKILQVDIKCLATVNGDVIIRITDGATDHDTTISNGNSTAQNTTDQEYSKGATMQLKKMSNSATIGDGCNITIQYRTA